MKIAVGRVIVKLESSEINHAQTVRFTVFTKRFSPSRRPHPDRIPADIPDPQDYDLQRHAGLRRGLHAPFPLGIQGNGALEVLLAVDFAGL